MSLESGIALSFAIVIFGGMLMTGVVVWVKLHEHKHLSHS